MGEGRDQVAIVLATMNPALAGRHRWMAARLRRTPTGAALVNFLRHLVMLGAVLAVGMAEAAALPERVTFASADGRTTLVGYVFKPEGPHPARVPAVVMMHGRAGTRAG